MQFPDEGSDSGLFNDMDRPSGVSHSEVLPDLLDPILDLERVIDGVRVGDRDLQLGDCKGRVDDVGGVGVEVTEVACLYKVLAELIFTKDPVS